MLLKVENVEIVQGDKLIVESLNFEVAEGEFVYLIGKTGSGKSSILKSLYADLEFKKGDIEIVGHQLSTLKRNEIPYLRRKIGIVFQDFQLFSDRSVYDNLLFVLEATDWKNTAKIKQRIDEVLQQVNLKHTQHKMPHQLSGGEQQRIAIARSLLNKPHILLVDEPTGNLDPTVANDILDLFVEINRGGTAILMATHNHGFLKRQPARVLYCENAQVKDIDKDLVIVKMSQ
jgi:cell division transport system ATP-binding protein